MKKIFLLLLSTVILATLFAQKTPVYHKGFYLSLGLGPSFGDIKAKDGVNNVINVRGSVLAMDMQIGGSLRPNLLVHGAVRVQTVISPVVNSVRFPDSYSFDENFIGAGITKYTTANFFATANIGAAYYTFSIPQTSFQPSSVSTDPGFSFNVKVGKEWLLSKKWGLGGALYFSSTHLTNKDPGSTEKWSSNRFGICVHATFNKISVN
ncbi:MAG: hypothetical protein V4685_17160 [Bacteroidota bacterium]